MPKNFTEGMQQVSLAAVLTLATMGAQAQTEQSMRIAKDPVTGQLRALTAEEHKALDAAGKGSVERSKSATARRESASASTEPAQIVHGGPTGVRGVRMTDESMSQSIVVRRADGTLQEVCVDPSHAHTVVKALQATGKASPSAALETQ